MDVFFAIYLMCTTPEASQLTCDPAHYRGTFATEEQCKASHDEGRSYFRVIGVPHVRAGCIKRSPGWTSQSPEGTSDVFEALGKDA